MLSEAEGRERDEFLALELRGPDILMVDGGGKTLLPGLSDAHFHLLWGSLRLDDMTPGGVRGLEGLEQAVAAYRRSHPDKTWLRGLGLSYDVLLGGKRHINRVRG